MKYWLRYINGVMVGLTTANMIYRGVDPVSFIIVLVLLAAAIMDKHK